VGPVSQSKRMRASAVSQSRGGRGERISCGSCGSANGVRQTRKTPLSGGAQLSAHGKRRAVGPRGGKWVLGQIDVPRPR
jgi:hypothetical protein